MTRSDKDVLWTPVVWRARQEPKWLSACKLWHDWQSPDADTPVTGSFKVLEAVPRVETEVPQAVSAALANMDLTEPGIARFVTEYGFLGVSQLTTVGDGTQSHTSKSETLDAWLEAVTVLRIVWREINGKQRDNEPGEKFLVAPFGDPAERPGAGYLQNYVWRIEAPALPASVRDQGSAYRFPRSEIAAVRPANLPTPVLEGTVVVGADDLAAARIAALCRAVSHYTNRLAGTSLVPDGWGARLVIIPRNLLGAAWLEMAQDLVTNEDSRFSECPECRRWYRSTRDDQTTCGRSSCRVRLYGKRRERARELIEAGATPDAVADQMTIETGRRVEASQVEKWVTASRKRRQGKPKGEGNAR